MQLTPSPRLRRSPFYDSTIADGATAFTVYNRMLMPTSYGDPDGEYDRLIHGVTMWDVAGERQVEITGPDARALVQYLAARDLTRMQAGQGKYVAMCDHDGRLLNDPVLLALAHDRYWFSLADHDMLLWCRAVAAERGCDVEVFEPDVSPLAVQGPRAVEVVADLFGDWVRGLGYFRFRETHLDAIPVVVCRSGWSKQGGFELFLRDGARGDDLWTRVKEAGIPHGIGPGAPNQVERVESGLLSWGADTTPDSNPFEAGMAGFVDVDLEPDYIGKAALQRIAAEGPRRLLTGLVLDPAAPQAWRLGERIPVTLDGEPVGTMSAVVDSPRLGRTIGIAQVRRDLVEAQVPLTVLTPQGEASATSRRLPFV